MAASAAATQGGKDAGHHALAFTRGLPTSSQWHEQAHTALRATPRSCTADCASQGSRLLMHELDNLSCLCVVEVCMAYTQQVSTPLSCRGCLATCCTAMSLDP